MKVVLATAPTLEPITVDELVAHVGLDDDILEVEGDNLADAVKDGRETVENITRRGILTQTWDYYLDAFPDADFIKIPFGNLASVTHIKYTNSAGTQTTMTVTTEYLAELNGEGLGRIVLPYGESWPSFTAYPTHPIVIRFVCGWTTLALVPKTIKRAVKFAAEDSYYHGDRSDILIPVVLRLLASSRLWDEF